MGNDGNSLLSYTFLWCNDDAAFCSVNGSYRNKRAFGAGFCRVVTQKSSALKSAASGLGLALVLQSSAAVALLVAGLAGAGKLLFSVGLAVILGADLGSALLIQDLVLPT